MAQKPRSLIGQTLGGRYKIESLLGRGGMSSVYRAMDENLKRAVAIKIIHPHLTKKPEFVQQFEQEATAVAQLRHQNIVRVFDFKRGQGLYYIVLEYIPGETLASKLEALNAANMNLPLTESVRIAINLCDAVDYAHQRRVIHRDIKPHNIMINLLGEPILMDFGITKLAGRDIKSLADKGALGSALYMAPEQAKGEAIDFRADIYSLGIVLFEMLSGQPPFQAPTTNGILQKQISIKLPDLYQINPNIPQALISVVERATEKQRDSRYQSAADMTTALQRIVLTLQNPLETLGSRQLEHLTRLWLQATEAFDSKDHVNCIEKIDELTRTGADYQTEQAAQLRAESTKRLYDQALELFHEGQFGEALLAVTSLRDLAPQYPNLGHLESQIRQSVQTDTIHSDLDTLYEEAVDALESHDYETALTKWQKINEKRGNLPYRDRMQVEERAKGGICARLYNDAFLAAAKEKPYLALDLWDQIKSIDPDFQDEDGVLGLTERLINTNEEVKERDKRLLIGALIVGTLFILTAVVLRFSDRGAVSAQEVASSSQATPVIAHTATSLSPTQTANPQLTEEGLAFLTSTKTATPTVTATTTETATVRATATAAITLTKTPISIPSATTTPVGTSLPSDIGLVLENSSIFAIPNLNGEELAVVEAGDSIVVIGRSIDNKWLFVGHGDIAGFVFRERLEWNGTAAELPVYTHSNTDAAAEASPEATGEITALEFDLWPLPETAVCTESGWEQDIFLQGHGSNGIYAYYWEGNFIEGPTSSSYVYRVTSLGGDLAGTGRVESGGGMWRESTIYIEAPNCE
ncbi:MAG: hypothetical protein CSA11_10515 [Chloroflexi bacterium]|nr:MAG: hypothetical protein CSA11_10515 [Chloroflexota bacterium]